VRVVARRLTADSAIVSLELVISLLVGGPLNNLKMLLLRRNIVGAYRHFAERDKPGPRAREDF